MPNVTVIIPNYNHGRFLRRRIQSVLDQTYQDYEILYLDDASQDDSAEVFAEFENHPRIRSIVNKENTGSTFVQWNRGMREAKGKYVWIAEADDYADPRLLQTLVETMEANPTVGLAYCQSWRVNELDEIGQSLIDCTAELDDARWLVDFIANGEDACIFLLQANFIPNASAVLFRREKFIEAGYADEGMRLCGDWMTYARVLMLSDLAFVARPLNYFRFHSNSVRSTTRALISIREHYTVQREILSRLSVSSEIQEQRLDQISVTFLAHAIANLRPGRARDILATYRAGALTDPKMGKRLLKHLTAYSLQRCGLLDWALAIARLRKRTNKNFSA